MNCVHSNRLSQKQSEKEVMGTINSGNCTLLCFKPIAFCGTSAGY